MVTAPFQTEMLCNRYSLEESLEAPVVVPPPQAASSRLRETSRSVVNVFKAKDP